MIVKKVSKDEFKIVLDESDANEIGNIEKIMDINMADLFTANLQGTLDTYGVACQSVIDKVQAGIED